MTSRTVNYHVRIRKGEISYIVATENTNDLAAAVELDEEPLVEVLVGKWSVSSLHHTKQTITWRSRCDKGIVSTRQLPFVVKDNSPMVISYLLQFRLCGRHCILRLCGLSGMVLRELLQ